MDSIRTPSTGGGFPLVGLWECILAWQSCVSPLGVVLGVEHREKRWKRSDIVRTQSHFLRGAKSTSRGVMERPTGRRLCVKYALNI